MYRDIPGFTHSSISRNTSSLYVQGYTDGSELRIACTGYTAQPIPSYSHVMIENSPKKS
jgi:hypothetical protein